MDVQQSSTTEFLTRMQIQRRDYFQKTRATESSKNEKNSESSSSAVDTVELSSQNPQANSAAQTQPASLRAKYGSFYLSSPNGDRLAELRARNEEMMRKYGTEATG